MGVKRKRVEREGWKWSGGRNADRGTEGIEAHAEAVTHSAWSSRYSSLGHLGPD